MQRKVEKPGAKRPSTSVKTAEAGIDGADAGARADADTAGRAAPKKLRALPKADKPTAAKAGKKKATKKKAAKKKAAKKVAKRTASATVPVRGKAGRLRALVVVESPAKAKTIKKYLGAGYTVKASVGHVKDLPKSKLSVDLEHGFAPNYEIIRGKSKVLKEIKDAARDADVIYLAPDPDREGEAIAWHIAEELGRRNQEHVHRITFNEITKAAVQEAIAHPQPLNRLRYESQQARRILDRIVGYQISPILWDKVRRGLSAGRVQSVAVRLLVEREAAIKAFVPEEYWSVECALADTDGTRFDARVVKEDGEAFRPSSGEVAHRAEAVLKQAAFSVAQVVRRERKRQPAAPLITSKLQQEAASRLRFTAKRTMMVAQQLYEGVELGEEGSVALITYMRTDSTRVSQGAIDAVRVHIGGHFGAEFVPESPVVYKSKKSAQDAHEAIRPTSMDYPPARVKAFLSPEQYRLYALIWRSFVACQMRPAVYDQTTVDIAAAQYGLRATGSIMKFAGFLAAWNEDADEESASDAGGEDAESRTGELPQLQQGDVVQAREIVPQQHFTQPPPRFSESSLVRELEEQGIGRPSTYATILSTIVTRGYVSKVDGRFFPTELGTLITGLLTESFPQVLDVAFTAHMETLLDDVEDGTADWVNVLSQFYRGGFEEALAHAKVHMRDIKREEIPTEHTCRDCSKVMNIKWGRNGSFLACSGYPECRNTRDYSRDVSGAVLILPEETTDKRCPTCSGPMLVKRGRFGQFLACEGYPECKGTRPMPIGVDCPNNCGGYLAERRSKRGRSFYGCSSYPNCTFAAWDRPVEGPCPLCASAYLVRKYSRRDGVLIKCPSKACGYTRDPELDDADVQAVAAG
jgi:DNA topoisomerase-1